MEWHFWLAGSVIWGHSVHLRFLQKQDFLNDASYTLMILLQPNSKLYVFPMTIHTKVTWAITIKSTFEIKKKKMKQD